MCDICQRVICPSSCPNADEPPVYTECEACGAEIYEGEKYYHVGGHDFCEDCVRYGHETAE